MATSNFHNVNASKIFAVEIEEEFDYDDLIENLTSEFSAKESFRSGGSDEHELRSYPSKVLGSLFKSANFGDIEVCTQISLIVRSGYYSGVNLDWQLKHTVCGEEVSVGDFKDVADYWSRLNKGLVTIQSKNAEKWAEKTAEELIAEVEKVYKDFSTPLDVVARFSNGETIYKKAEVEA
jgi:hypothetical protein